MRTEKTPFQLVIDIDEKGSRATACYRTRVYGDDDKIIEAATFVTAVTLAELGDNFPWSEFIDAATAGALIQTETAILEAKAAKEEQSALKSKLGAASSNLEAATLSNTRLTDALRQTIIERDYLSDVITAARNAQREASQTAAAL